MKPVSRALSVFAAVAFLGLYCIGCAHVEPDASQKRVLILGFDGMDPNLLTEFMKDGGMPHFASLIEVNRDYTLATSDPPQSPVAWANFITGSNPGGHDIYDFIARDPENYIPYLSTSRTVPPKRLLRIGNYEIPLSKGRVELLRRGTAFWELLERSGVQTTVFRVPSNFPPVPFGRSLAGMGTPDITGGYGSFTFCTTTMPRNAKEITGGKVYLLKVRNGHADCEIEGPANNLRKGHPVVKATMEIWVDPENPSAKIRIGKETHLLKEGEWSRWIPINFPLIEHVSCVRGMVLVYLKKAHPDIELYISPVNIDPMRPALPISNPGGYARELAEKVGRFYTQGMPEDTKALDHGIFTDAEFLGQTGVFNESIERIYDYELRRFKSGFMFFYFSDTDLNSHMFWSATDASHPQNAKRDAGSRAVLKKTYRKMDRMLGKALNKLRKGDTLLVMSDHGFAPYERAFNLNSWLKDNGYLALTGGTGRDAGEFLENVDWTLTRAYGLGFNALYINMEGREGEGIVSASEKKALMLEIRSKLEALVDPKTGAHPISHVYLADDIYQPEYLRNAPDLIVGYNRGYRASWETAIGKFPKQWIMENKEKWSGDHCIDAALVPGIILSNRKIKLQRPALTDIAPTVLSEFGIKKKSGMIGHSLF